MSFFDEQCDAGSYSPLALAFVGDGVYELLTREYLALQANRPAGELSIRKVHMVNAAAQADGFERIRAVLTEQELAVFKRGRNAHTVRAPKNASRAQYHCATGVEALFGWLYLSGDSRRAAELYRLMNPGEPEE